MILTALSLVLAFGSPQAKGQSGIQLPQNPPGKAVQLPPDPAAAPKIADVGVQGQAMLNITKHIAGHFDPGMEPVNGHWAGGTSEQEIREGELIFSLENSTFQGKPCKLFRGNSEWDFHPNVRNRHVVFSPRLYVFAHIGLDGRLLHTNTSYAGFGAPIQIDALYNKDSIDITKSEGTSVTSTTLYPNFSMDLFNNLFDPLMKDGLIVTQQRQLAFLSPITGAPCTTTISVDKRFQGKLYFRSYEGYNFATTSPDTEMLLKSMVSRQGQLLQITLPNDQEAMAYSYVSVDEEKAWGKFTPGDWERPASQTQPNRSRYRTFVAPILLLKPSYLILPVPYAVAL